MSKILEKDVQQAHIDFMAARSWRFVRTQFATMPGMFATGEPGQPDGFFVRYMPAPELPSRALFVWCEFKGPNDQRSCRCTVELNKRGREVKKVCKICRQKAWHDRERGRGAIVVVSNDIATFARWYEREFGWLHRGQVEPIGEEPVAEQLELLP